MASVGGVIFSLRNTVGERYDVKGSSEHGCPRTVSVERQSAPPKRLRTHQLCPEGQVLPI